MKMNRILILIASALLLVIGCKNEVNNQEVYDQFTADMQALVDDYNKQYSEIMKNSSSNYAETTDKVEALETKTLELIKKKSLDIIKKYPSDSVAVAALSESLSYLEPQEIEKVLKSLKGQAAQMEEVAIIRKNLDVKAATAEGKMFTDFTITQPDGTVFNLSDIVGKGKYILVDFWSWWCGPCKREVPNLIEVYNRFHGDQFDMLSVGVWERGTPEKCTEVAAELGVCWNQTINGGNIPTDCYGIEGIPHIILFGPDGTILKRDLRGSAITTELEKYL